MSTASGLSAEDIESRIRQLIINFEKVDKNKYTPQADFHKDLGLDSLDQVEIAMAVEEEFSIEIPDGAADNFRTSSEIVNYILTRPDAQ